MDVDMIVMLHDTAGHFDIGSLLDTRKDDTPTTTEALHCISMLPKKRNGETGGYPQTLSCIAMDKFSGVISFHSRPFFF